MERAPVSELIDVDAARQFALSVVRKLREGGYQALWAGGCVRDHLRGQRPKDYDVATDARPDEIRVMFGRRRTRFIGAAFGVVSVVGPRRAGHIEVATFRRDEGYSDGRHPDRVAYSTAEEDARRRDFTINGLFFDPLSLEVIDYVNGQSDITAGIIRCIGHPPDRFTEDKLRMLRAVRFATTLDYRVEPVTLSAIQNQAEQIAGVSAERIAAEMRQILCDPNRQTGLELLQESGLWRVVLPEYADLGEPERTACWEQLETILGQLQTEQFSTALAATLWPVDQLPQSDTTSLVARLARRWRLARLEQSETEWLLKQVTITRHARQVPWPQLQRVLIDDSASELLALSRAIGLAIDGTDHDFLYCQQQRQLPAEQFNPPALVNGNDLRGLGIPTGPHFSTLLNEVRDAQLEGRIQTRQAALNWAEQRWKQMCPHE
jgi:tRNA nucleotidyltransferase/poly(A) polymerase